MDNNQATTLGNAAAATAPDTAALDKGKHKATQDSTSMDVSMDEGESDESENEDIVSLRDPLHSNQDTRPDCFSFHRWKVTTEIFLEA